MPHFDFDWKVELMQIRQRMEELYAHVFMPCQPIAPLYRCVTGLGKGPEPLPKNGWAPFEVMDRWGGHDQTTWFRMQATIPPEFSGKRVAVLLNPCAYSHVSGAGAYDESGEGLAYVNGVPRQGIDRNHNFMVLTEKARTGERYDIALECCPSTRFDASHVFSRADLAVMNRPLWDFYWDVMTYADVAEQLPESDTARRRLFTLLLAATQKVDLQHAQDNVRLTASVAEARQYLTRGMRAFPAAEHAGALTLIGHSHIDTAWLWPLRETRRKVGRTFSTVLRLMEQYPEFHFSASQPELYMFVKEHYPELWKGIKRRVKEGRWEPCGATWVEQDSNISGGEALIRQLLYGNRFYEKEFGKRSSVAWLPDAFGFPWSLPQLLVKAGITTFHTIKISWSRYTRFPFSYFEWQGVDGTRIRAVMPPLNYNGDPTPDQCIRQWNGFAQKHLVSEVPFSIGWGDGGGGPTPKMIEYGKRLANVTGVPRCQFGNTEDCYARMRGSVDAKALPVHNGELYLELHRACQTTQARTKRNNRKCEWLLHDAELLMSFASLYGLEYDQETLLSAWRTLLTHQFHDILPGSSITEVYADADRNYQAIRDQIEPLLHQAQTFLASRMDGQGPGTPIIVWNPLSWERTDIACLEAAPIAEPFHIVGPNGMPVPMQQCSDGKLRFQAQNIPALGYAIYHMVSGAAAPAPKPMLKVQPKRLENRFVRIDLDNRGCFKRVYDKIVGRDVIAPGQFGNEWQLFEDRPAEHDAWDFDFNFESMAWEPDKAESMEVVENGPLRAMVRVVRRTERSVFTQDITLYADSPRIEVHGHVDWHEKRCLLKVAFPVDILSAKATYHIQFAAIERSTHKNTEFDHARFETPAHYWADLSEADYGVSLLNDCKYGYDVRDNVLRLSLLRAPIEPDPHADEGEHLFTYALYPHAGDWRDSVVREGYALNAPLHAWTAPCGAAAALPPSMALVEVDRPGVIVETLKKAEDSHALVLRVYEAHGGRGPVHIRIHMPIKDVRECNLMEDASFSLPMYNENVLSFDIKPFEIRTFLLFP